jgi:hypothetical protein
MVVLLVLDYRRATNQRSHGPHFPPKVHYYYGKARIKSEDPEFDPLGVDLFSLLPLFSVSIILLLKFRS